MDTLTEAERFFYEHAGYSHTPDETPEQGRARGARALAAAERWASEQGYAVEWETDSDADYDDRGTEWADWPHYMATLWDRAGGILSSLGSVMFAAPGTEDPGTPYDGNYYRRVVEAELALEAMDEVVGRP